MNFYKKFIAYILAIALLTLSLAGLQRQKAATMPAATARSRGAGGRRPQRLRWRIIL